MASYEALAVPRQQIFSLDVAQVSDRVALSTDELLTGLATSRPSASSLAPGQAEAYSVCLLVQADGESGRCRALQGLEDGPTVLELLLRRLLQPLCVRLVVCGVGDAVGPELDAIVTSEYDSIVTVLHETDTLCALRKACEILVDTKSTQPLVVMQTDRAFDTLTIMELLLQHRNATILTGDLTQVLSLVDHKDSEHLPRPMGLWICSTLAIDRLCRSDPSVFKGQDTTVTARYVQQWLETLVGDCACQDVMASETFNWEEVVDSGKDDQVTLVWRFPAQDNMDVKSVKRSSRTSRGSSTFEASNPVLTLLQQQLADEGVNAELYPISTRVSYESMGEGTTERSTERTPLLLNESTSPVRTGSLESTMLSEIDLLDSAQVTEASSQAFLIQVETPSVTSGTELILALPETALRAIEASPSLESIEMRPTGGRRFSVPRARLPSGVKEITLEAILEPTIKPNVRTKRLSVMLHVHKQVPTIGYIILITAVCAVSSQGAALELLMGVPPLLKLFWRMTGASIAFLPLAALSVYKDGLPAILTHKKLSFLVCAMSYTIYNGTFLIALSLTSLGHAYIFCNSHSLIMVLGKLILRQPLGPLELIGAALGFSGGVITTMDHSEASPSESIVQASPAGDLIAFAGAFGGVLYLICAKQVRASLDVRVFLFLLVTSVWTLLLPVLLWNRHKLGVQLSNITDPHTGLFGWIHHIGIELYLVIIGSMCGTMGFITSLKYFDPLVVSVSMLTEPVVATTFGILVGVDQIPGWPTFIGGFAVLLGCLLVVIASHNTTVKVDVSDTLTKTRYTSARSVLLEQGADYPEDLTTGAVRPSTTGRYGSMT
ncbi:hypothetical protein Poli38472_000232 [Pythium oligandrum]|uniref:EamA domain-containing protein n=1 Tax=Pythium oligandrum TaxID=41045 RepID=A0A8K1CBQ4_PYTOL|nr:hypothetical protein Poli38472_000232 [Pythium oligandrum]|eukprot:TMW60190.1 hypothetical protein Poli38472_000232 [Pythium oligandrum]